MLESIAAEQPELLVEHAHTTVITLHSLCKTVVSLCIKTTSLLHANCTFHAAFEISPINKTVTVNDTNIELHCQKASNLDSSIWEVFLNNGTFWTVTGADIEIHLSRLV